MEYPLVFGFREAVYGNGFMAGVVVNGRALAEQEPDTWWIYGVEPGALAASGSTLIEAYQNFRQTFKEVLFDSASMTTSYEDFRADVLHCFAGVDAEDARRWDEARRTIRNGIARPEPPVDSLPLQTREVRCSLEVVRLDVAGRLSAQQNQKALFARQKDELAVVRAA